MRNLNKIEFFVVRRDKYERVGCCFTKAKFPHVYFQALFSGTGVIRGFSKKKIIPSDKLVEVLELFKNCLILHICIFAYLATVISADCQTTLMFSQVECLYYGKLILFVLSFVREPNFRSRFLDIDFDKLSLKQ